jgi:alkyl sulfatase BDS1-like metallo-beta-lactamase superfamily hydrolase
MTDPSPGEPDRPDAGLRTDAATLNALLDGTADLDAAVSGGSAAVAGDRAVLRRLIAAVTTPAAA